MGHRSWFTSVYSKHEWRDLWMTLSELQESWHDLRSRPIEELTSVPAYFEMDYVLKVTKEGGPFRRGSAVLAWSSSGDYTIRSLPYYLRQQTEYIETVLSKYPTFHERPLGPAAFGEMFLPIPTNGAVAEEWKAQPNDTNILEFLIKRLPFLADLPDTAEAEWGERTEANFIDHLYYKNFRDPSALSDINQSVFISYSSKDKRFARGIDRELKAYGLRTWIDEGELRIGDSLIWKISEAVDQADFFLVIISENSIESSWVRQELEIAMTQQLTQGRYKVLPVKKDTCDMPTFLRGKLYSDFSKPGKRKENIKRLVSSILPMRTGVDDLIQAIEKAGGTVRKDFELKRS